MSEPKCNCDGCHVDLCKGKYTCSTNDYRITAEDGTFVRTMDSHDLPDDNIEVGSSDKFKQKDNNEISYYDYYLNYNIIHNFDNIKCEHCSNILEKGKFTLEIIEETEENLSTLSMPNDFIKDIHIYNLENSLIKTIEPNDYQEYIELHNYTTDESKNLLYCSNCNFCILNSLH